MDSRQITDLNDEEQIKIYLDIINSKQHLNLIIGDISEAEKKSDLLHIRFLPLSFFKIMDMLEIPKDECINYIDFTTETETHITESVMSPLRSPMQVRELHIERESVRSSSQTLSTLPQEDDPYFIAVNPTKKLPKHQLMQDSEHIDHLHKLAEDFEGECKHEHGKNPKVFDTHIKRQSIFTEDDDTEDINRFGDIFGQEATALKMKPKSPRPGKKEETFKPAFVEIKNEVAPVQELKKKEEGK
jgi:hypothetical protein